MKTWTNIFIKFWWFIQGITLLVFGFLACIPLSFIGIFVIICDYFYDSRNHKIQGTSRTILFIYALVYIIYGGMLIAVASPEVGFAILLIIVGLVNMVLSIKLLINAFLNRK